MDDFFLSLLSADGFLVGFAAGVVVFAPLLLVLGIEMGKARAWRAIRDEFTSEREAIAYGDVPHVPR